MTTKDQAIARFIEAVKLDRHDWQDWPTDSREAFVALQQPAPDCRTCDYRETDADKKDVCYAGCVNGDEYRTAPKMVLWRTE